MLRWQMQRTCLAHFENMHIGEFEYQGTSGLVAEHIVAIDCDPGSIPGRCIGANCWISAQHQAGKFISVGWAVRRRRHIALGSLCRVICRVCLCVGIPFLFRSSP